ncbi:unnamed protein product [Angiostrongylus costaricensis]|uniref:Protein hedgehog n=1 Tax=Angiostrongylus costaricensis TaxID=334426 RepID=A0A0R3PZ61_ANGCS|nr:unnamed protein product [Angiostrongylus costaricensis]
MTVFATILLISAALHDADLSDMLVENTTEQFPYDGSTSVAVDSISTVLPTSPKLMNTSSFQSDCSDPHNKEISCSVHVVDCGKKLFEDVAPGHEPAEAHDVRVEAFAKAMARRERHQLHVDVSWQISPESVQAPDQRQRRQSVLRVQRLGFRMDTRFIIEFNYDDDQRNMSQYCKTHSKSIDFIIVIKRTDYISPLLH